MEAENPEADILDQIESMYIHEKRTRRQIGIKLKDLGLITSIKVKVERVALEAVFRRQIM